MSKVKTNRLKIVKGTMSIINPEIDDGYGDLHVAGNLNPTPCNIKSYFYIYKWFNKSNIQVGVKNGIPLHRLTIIAPGHYLVLVTGSVGGTPGHIFQWEIHQNGKRTMAACSVSLMNETRVSIACSTMLDLEKNDYIDLRVRCLTADQAAAHGHDMSLCLRGL